MKVYFIGAGPGAADLITLRGARLLGRVGMVLYAGSLVPTEMLAHCQPGTELIDTAALDLEQQQACYLRARDGDMDVVRLHSGDPAIYGATAEQMRRLDALGIGYEVVPGVSSFTAAAAAVAAELTKPEVSQSVILTRVSGRASAVPESESIASLAAHRATMCIFLSGPHLKKIVGDLLLHYPPATPVALVYRASWPQQRIYQGTLARVLEENRRGEWNLTTMMLVGAALDREQVAESSLYAKDFSHLFRVVKKPAPTAGWDVMSAAVAAAEPGIWPVRVQAEPLALHLHAHLGGTLYRPWLNELRQPQPQPQRQQFAAAFHHQRLWVMIGAAGIVVRFLDGLVRDKRSDPGVVSLDEAARFAQSLLGGHEGGANGLAYRVARVSGAVPVVSTATEAIKPLVLGLGCRRGASLEQITKAIHQALAQVDGALEQVRELATIDIKADEPGLVAFCAVHDLPLRVLSTAQIAQRAWVSQPSEWVRQNVGVDGVCEPAALIACPRGRLVLGKTACDGVTVAVVEDGRGWSPVGAT